MRRPIARSAWSSRTTCCFSNYAHAGQIAGGGVSSFALTSDATFAVTLDSDNPDLDDTMRVTLLRLASPVCCKSQSFL
jgi:hypothetical protein